MPSSEPDSRPWMHRAVAGRGHAVAASLRPLVAGGLQPLVAEPNEGARRADLGAVGPPHLEHDSVLAVLNDLVRVRVGFRVRVRLGVKVGVRVRVGVRVGVRGWG